MFVEHIRRESQTLPIPHGVENVKGMVLRSIPPDLVGVWVAVHRIS